MKKLTLLFAVLFATHGMNAQLVITEIMYNPPESGTDSLEYIEIYNNGPDAVDMTGFSFDQGVDFTFPSFSLMSADYVVVCVDSAALASTLGIDSAFEWFSGGLSNGGEDIILVDDQNNILDVVDYENGGDWPAEANGEGASLELCDPGKDNSLAANWKASQSNKGIVINGKELRASPAADNSVSCADHTIEVRNNIFSPDTLIINKGETIEWICMEGIHNVNGSLAVGPNNPVAFLSGAPRSAPWSFSFTFDVPGAYDYRCDPHFLLGMTGHIVVEDHTTPQIVISEIMYNNPGIDSLEYVELFNASDVPVALGDFRMINAFNHLFADFTIPEQSYLVLAKYKDKFEAVFGVPALEWDEGTLNNTGEAIEIIDPQGRSVDRVLYSRDAPWNGRANGEGHALILCDVLADNSDPANWSVSWFDTGIDYEGARLYANPGNSDECKEIKQDYPLYTIADVTNEDPAGNADSLGVKCSLRGIVHGVDLQGGGSIQFTLIDQTGGIGLFSTNNFNYTVTEGDELLVKGEISQFNGLTQINPDSLEVLGTGNPTVSPRLTTQLDESTESELVRLENLTFVNAGDWNDSGGSFNIDVTNGTGIFTVRIDNDVDIAGMPIPDEPFNLTGIGGQFDTSEPYTDGYQILPRYLEDIDELTSIAYSGLVDLKVFPNPTDAFIQIENGPKELTLTLFDLAGNTLIKAKGDRIKVETFPAGMYFLEVANNESSKYFKVIKN